MQNKHKLQNTPAYISEHTLPHAIHAWVYMSINVMSIHSMYGWKDVSILMSSVATTLLCTLSHAWSDEGINRKVN